MRSPAYIINEVAASSGLSHTARLQILRRYGLIADDAAYIAAQVFFSQPSLSNIRLGYKVFISDRCYLDNHASIEIGDNSCIAVGSSILTTTHEIGSADRRVGHGCVTKPIAIGRGCWIGANVTILPGVTVGDGVVIGAGAVVCRDCQDNGLYVGVPARLVRVLA